MEGITEYQLDNGLKLLLFPDNSRPTVTVNMTVLVGSRHEGYGEAGMAHLLEHMLFKGTPTYPDGWKILRERELRQMARHGMTAPTITKRSPQATAIWSSLFVSRLIA